MRTVTAQEAKVQALPHWRMNFRVWVKDYLGIYQDLSTLGGMGFNWCDGIEYNFDVDQPVADATVHLRRDFYQYSLAPLVGGSKFNIAAPQIDVGRQIKIETATIPMDPGYVIQSADWQNVFEGYIDEIDVGSGTESAPITLQCRDLGALLQERWLEAQGRSGGPPWNPYGSIVGVPVETVMQQLLDDWVGGVTLFTPNGTNATPINAGDVAGWNITRFKPDNQCILDALRILANQIGYEVRYRWNTIDSPKWRLEFFNPPRTKSVPDGTINVNQYFSMRRVGISRAGIRNVVVVSYQTDSNDPTTRTAYTASDATSITKYGRKWMGLTEGATSAINTLTEATKMGDAILKDTKDPKVEQECEASYLYHLELGDLLTFKSNAIHYDADQNLAVVGIRTRLSMDQQRMQILCRGTPVGSYSNWLKDAGVAGNSPPVNTWGGDVIAVGPNVTGVVGGIEIGPNSTKLDEDLLHYEVHVSTTTGFTPDSTTLKGKVLGTKMQVLGLPSQTHYAKLVPVRKSGVKGTASPQTSAVANQTQLALNPQAPANNAPLQAVWDVATTNVITNPSFEVNTNDWVAIGGITISRDTGQSWMGAASLKLAAMGAAENGAKTSPGTLINANPGEYYTLSAYIKVPVALTKVKLRIEFFQANGTTSTAQHTSADIAIPGSGIEASANGFFRIHFQNPSAAPALTAKVQFSVMNGGTNPTCDVYVDAVQAELTTSLYDGPTTFCMGDMGPAYKWNGTAHASSSSRVAGLAVIAPQTITAVPFSLLTDGISRGPKFVATNRNDHTNECWLGDTGIFGVGTNPDIPVSVSSKGKSPAYIGRSGSELAIAGMGTSFPASPNTSDVFFRTDKQMLFFWDGTRWLSVNEYTLNTPGSTYAASTTTAFLAPDYVGGGGTHVYMTRILHAHQESVLQGAVNHWQIKVTDNAGATIGAVFDTQTLPDAAATTYLSSQAVNSDRAMGADARWLVVITAFGAPGNLQLNTTITYRVIGV